MASSPTDIGGNMEQDSSNSVNPENGSTSRTEDASPTAKYIDKAVQVELRPESVIVESKPVVVVKSISDVQMETPPQKSNWLKRLLQKKVEGLTRRQIYICVIFAFVEFFAATVISIQAPFFPDVAAAKGATPIEYGFVFGIFELTVFIMSPIFGAKMNYFGVKRLFNWGIFTTGACCVIFGFLDFLQGRTEFVVACFVVRTVEAIGDAAFVVASFTIIALEFPDSVATTFGTMETFYGLGMIVGPTLGGALYEVGGYTLPFALMGSLLFVCAWATYFFLPEIGETPSIEKGDQKLVTTSGLETFQMLRFPVIFMIAYSIVATAAGVGFLHSTLEPHLDIAQANLNKFYVGAVFILNGGVYALTAPTWGRIADQAKQPKYFTVIGSIFTICGFILVGPLPFLPWETSLWNICIGLVLFGLGLGATLVSAFIQALQDAVSLGYPDDVSTYGLVSGLWTSMTALGFFIGASSGGVLSHYVGFRSGTAVILCGQFILVIMLIVYFYKQRGNKKGNDSDTNPGKQEIPLDCTEIVDTNAPPTSPSAVKMNGAINNTSSSVSATAATNPSFENDE